MSKYEYKVEILPRDEKQAEARLNVIGQDNWELVSADSSSNFFRAVFKRELESTVGLS